MSNKNSFLKVELIQQYDVINQSYVEDRNVKLDIHSIQNGIIKEIGASEFVVLMAIASFTDLEGEAFPSQRRLAEVTGLSLPTVNKLVNRLLEIEVNGVPVLSRKFEQTKNKRNFSVYSLNTVKPENEESDLKVNFQEVEVEEKPKKKTAKDYSAKFCSMYEEEFGVKYIPSYARDMSLIKSKLMANFTEEQINDLITYVIKNYRERWAKPSYPYPTIPMMCGWLGNTALQLMQKDKEKAMESEKLEELTAQYVDADYSDFDKILNL